LLINELIKFLLLSVQNLLRAKNNCSSFDLDK